MAETVQSVVTAEPRQGLGKGPARRLRGKGLIPAVVYGKQGKPISIAVDPAAIELAIATPLKLNTLIALKVDGGEKRVLLKEYQVDPVTRQLLHADFLEVALDKPVKVEVPVITTGKAEGVTDGGILSIAAHTVAVQALPDRIPVQIEVDVTALKIGQSIHISELHPPAGCKFTFATDYVVAFVAVPEKEEVVAPVAAVPGLEGAAVPGAPAAPGAPGAPAVPGAPGAAPAPGVAPGAAAAAAPAAGAPAKGAAPAKGGPPGKGGEAKPGKK